MTVIGFAHRGAPRWGVRENTIAAFTAAIAAGARALESDVWVTADGVAVLDHDGVLRRRPRSAIPIATLPRSALPAWVPSLSELYDAVGTALPLSLDVKGPGAAPAALEAAIAAGAVRDLWLCGSLAEVTAWRSLSADVRLVDSTRTRFLPEGVAARAAAIATAGGQALNLKWREWTRTDVDAVHAAGVLAFGWDAHTRWAVRGAAALGLDGVFGDSVKALAQLAAGVG